MYCADPADDKIISYIHTELREVFNLSINNILWQSKLGYAVLEHAAALVKCLEYGDIITKLNHIPCTGQSSRATPNNRYFLAILRR